MKRPATILALLLLTGPAPAESRICRVADPTGTPLNVRLEPNGRVVATVPDGAPVQVFAGEDRRDAKGRPWHLVALIDSTAPDGYAFAAFIRCSRSPRSTPASGS